MFQTALRLYFKVKLLLCLLLATSVVSKAQTANVAPSIEWEACFFISMHEHDTLYSGDFSIHLTSTYFQLRGYDKTMTKMVNGVGKKEIHPIDFVYQQDIILCDGTLQIQFDASTQCPVAAFLKLNNGKVYYFADQWGIN
jgi:hypothetical protein